MAPLFALAPPPTGTFTLPPLSSAAPRFALPRLDEDAPGVERLLGLGPGVPIAADDLVLAKHETGPRPQTPPAEPLIADEVDASEADADEWTRAADVAGPSRQSIRTWATTPSPFLSEHPPAFEALLTTHEPPVHLAHVRTSPPAAEDARSLLALMMRATLGTAMARVRWSGRQGRFVIAGTRPRGVERATAAGVMDEFLTIGSAVRRLEIVVEEHSATPLTPTHHALLYALSTLLTYVKGRLSDSVGVAVTRESAPWIKRTVGFRELRELVTALCEVMCWPIHQTRPVGLPARPASVLTHLHAHLLARLSTSTAEQQRGYVCLALAFLLSRASTPFLDLLQEWLGLSGSGRADEDNDPTAQPWADLGITRKRVHSEAPGGSARWEYSFSSRRMPAFVPRDVRRTLFEAGRSLRALRDASGGLHPLWATDWPVHVSWGWGSDETPFDIRIHTRRVEREIDRWRGSHTLTRTLSSSSMGSFRLGPGKERRRFATPPGSTPTSSLPPSPRKGLPEHGDKPDSPTKPKPTSHAGMPDPELWAAFDAAPGSHVAGTTPLWTPTPLDELGVFVARHIDPAHPLLPADAPTLELYISRHLLAPLLAHATLISRALITLYLDDLHFLDHLDVLRAFWLGGDAGFAERVGKALFGDGDEGAVGAGMGQRERTRARLGLGSDARHAHGQGHAKREHEWGVGLGIGLSDRKRWPPGGAELAYALRTTLLDDEMGQHALGGAVSEGIEDRVSFAVKALPQDEREGRRARWLNPQAIEALDFLYLAYTPPTALESLLPQSIMDKYQLIHNLLLRLSRVQAVTRTLYFEVVHLVPGGPPANIKAHRRAPPTRAGVFPAGSEAEGNVLYLRFWMTWFATTVSRYVLDTAIGRNWDVMRRRLDKLRRRAHGAHAVAVDSRPVTPTLDGDDEYEDLDGEVGEAEAEPMSEPLNDGDKDDDGEGEGEGDDTTPLGSLGALSQLQSAHSLVLYHQIILNRILRACLLSPQPGQQVTFKILMTLLGLVLDLAKVLADVEGGFVTLETGAEHVSTIRQDWADKMAVFLHALERLSLRTPKAPTDDTRHDRDRGGGGDAPASASAEDLQLLLDGERGRDEDGHDAVAGKHVPGSAELQELLLRLRLGASNRRRE